MTVLETTVGVRPVLEVRPLWQRVVLGLFIGAPLAAIGLGVWLAVQGHGITWLDAGLALVMYAVTGHGITVGFHRYLTHGSFKAKRPLRIALAVAGSMAVEGGVIRWVADHRRHHAHADDEGDPHSPWRFGTSAGALLKGMWWAHTGWMLDHERSNCDRYAPDLLADKDIVRVHNMFWRLTTLSFALPAVIVFAVSGGSWSAAGLAFLWASVVRVFVLHHVTWSINSICHVWGERPFRTRDRSTNVAPLAVLSMGESWHNLHHADPTCARHGVDRGQLDSSGRLIWFFEKFGWAYDVRWPREERLATRRA